MQQTEFVGKFKKTYANDNALDSRTGESMFVLLVLEKSKETTLKCPQGSVTVL